MNNVQDRPLGRLLVEWPAPGRLRPVLALLLRAAFFAVLAVPVAVFAGMALGNPGPVLVLLWFLILIKIMPQILGRLFLAERRVAVHEHGIAIDDEVLLWPEIQSVNYYGHLHHLDKNKVAAHVWTFKLEDREDVLLRASNDYLGSHVDCAKLDEMLEGKVSDYRRFHDAEVVDDRPAMVGAVPKRAIDANAGVEAATPPQVLWSDVLRRLRLGARRRSWRIAGLRARSVVARFLPKAMWPLMHLVFVVVLFAAMELCIQVIGILSGSDPGLMLFRGFPLPAGLPSLLILPVLGYGGLKIGMALYLASDKLEQWATRYGATLDQLTRSSSKVGVQELERVGKKGLRFALYLRSFRGEYFRYEERRADISSRLETKAHAREFDSELVRLMADRSKCFGLANLEDPTPPDALIQLFVLNRDWPMVVDQLMARARWIALYLSAESPGLLREMTVLSRLGIQDRVLVVLPKPGSDDVPTADREALLGGFPNRIEEEAGDLEATIAAFMRS